MKDLRFAARMDRASGSVVREILKLTQQKDIISFGGGMPSADSFPAEELRLAAEKAFLEDSNLTLQYGVSEGYLPLRKYIVNWMQQKGMDITVDNVLILSGSQQGLDLMSKAFLNADDQVVVESPSYLSAFQIFNLYQAQFLMVPSDLSGMEVDKLEAMLEENKPKLLYVIPTFQNPTGITMTLERRKKLLEIAAKHNVIIIEDDPYGWLRYEGEELPTLKALDKNDQVVYLGSFSKIVSPGLRVGFAIGDPAILGKMVIGKQTTDVHTNNLAQRMIHSFCTDSSLEGHIEKIGVMYKEKRDLMLSAMDKYFPTELTWTRPEGGLFIWATLPEGLNSKELLEKAIQAKVAIIPGEPFFADGSVKNTFRLNFSNADKALIEVGIEKLGKTIKAFLTEKGI